MSKALDKVWNCRVEPHESKAQRTLYSSDELAGATSFLDPLLCGLGELLGAHKAWDGGKLSLTEHLGVALFNAIIIY